MADVFVSYARGDQSLVHKISRRLIEAGFTVWWDTELLPHNRFANVIESEIGAARAVLVVWSERAAQSQWVRAEAELGRQHDKLIQVVTDQSPIPLPFNQFQAADLRRWSGDADDPDWRKVVASVAHFAATAGTNDPASIPTTPPGRKAKPVTRRRHALAIGAASLVLAVSGAVLVSRLAQPEPRGQRIAIQPFRPIGGAPALKDFSAGLTDSLQNVLTQDQLQTVSASDAETLKADDLANRMRALGVGLLFSGTVRDDGPKVAVSMRLDDPVRQATLWTAEISGPAAQFDQLQARAGALTVAVLNCSAQGLAPGARLTDQALQAFLHACELSQTSNHGLTDTRSAFAMLDAMRQAARAAPDFAAAHSVLAKHLAFALSNMPPDQAASLRSEAEQEAHRALALDPKDPDGYVALGLLTPPLDFAKREAFYRRALASNPAWPHANGFLGNVMSDVGRLQDAAALYARAAAVNPQSEDWAAAAAGGLIRIGETGEADRELARLAQLWPDDSTIPVLQLFSLIAQRRWADGLKLLDGTKDVPSLGAWAADWRQILSALQSGDGVKRDALRRSLLASSSAHPERTILRLAILGFVDDAFGVSQKDLRVGRDQGDSPDYLFLAGTDALHRDPRFIALAARYGLVDYWRRTGQWADFCREPGLPYDCRQESEKLQRRNPA